MSSLPSKTNKEDSCRFGLSKYNVRPCHRIDTGRFHFLWKSCINASANNVQRKQPNLQAGPWEPVNGKTEGACLGDAGNNGNRKPRQALVPCQFNCWRIRCVVTNSNDTQDGQSVCCVCPVFVCFPRRILRSNCKQDRWHFYTFSLFSVHNHWQKHLRQRVIFSRGHSWYDFFFKKSIMNPWILLNKYIFCQVWKENHDKIKV